MSVRNEPAAVEPDAERRPRVTGARYLLLSLLLWSLAAVSVLAMAELALRIYTPFEIVVRGDRIVLPVNRRVTINTRSDSFRSSAFVRERLDPTIMLTTNSLGFRGPEPPVDIERTLSILTVGGSSAECMYLTDGKTWPDQLARGLSATFSPLWLNNAGLDGHSTFGHTVLMEDHIVALHPKVVLFLIGVNDLHAEAPLDADTRVQRAGIDTSSIKSALISAANYSQTVAVGLNLYRHLRARTVGFDYNTDFDLRTAVTRQLSDAEWTQAAQAYADRLPAFRNRVANLVAIARRAGIEPVLITQPALYGPTADDVTGADLGELAVMDVNGTLGWRVLETFNEATRQIGRSEGVFVVDLAAELPKSSRYFYDFYHYTNEGAAAVAAIVGRALCPFLAAKYPVHVRAACP